MILTPLAVRHPDPTRSARRRRWKARAGRAARAVGRWLLLAAVALVLAALAMVGGWP